MKDKAKYLELAGWANRETERAPWGDVVTNTWHPLDSAYAIQMLRDAIIMNLMRRFFGGDNEEALDLEAAPLLGPTLEQLAALSRKRGSND